jgi:hypothetical protein
MVAKSIALFVLAALTPRDKSDIFVSVRPTTNALVDIG